MPSAIAEAFVRLRPDVSTFRAESQAGVAGALAGGGGLAGAFGKVGPAAIAATAGVLGFTAATQAAAVAAREIVGGAAEFEQNMDVLQVVTQSTGENMERISNLAKDLGADLELPGTSANDAATALLELSKAGLTVTDTMNGAKGALQLAAAAEIEAGEAAKVIGSALNTFSLAGNQATHVADLLAAASIAAQGEIHDMALALQQVGAVANQAGLSIEQTTAVIGLLAKNGILGSDAGTSIRTTLLKLIPTTKEASAAIEALGINIDENATLGEQLPQLIEQYQGALAKLNPTLRQQALTQIFGTDAIRAASILFEEGALGLADMTDEVNRNGAASELAAAKTKGLAGQFDGLKSQLSSLAVELGEVVNPALAGFVGTVNSVLSPVISLTRTVKDLTGAFLDLNIPGTDFGFADAFSFMRDQATGANFVKGVKAIKDQIVDTKEETKDLRKEMAEAGTFIAAPDIIDRNAAVSAARDAGRPVGNQFGQSVAEGIAASKPAALSAAQQTVRDVAAQGRAAIAAAIAGAQQNLSSIGSSLASDAGAIIDATVEQGLKSVGSSGGATQSAGQRARQEKAIRRAQAELDLAIANVPIQREIERLQAQLDRESGRDAATDVRRGLRDAKEELAAAQKQLQSTGTLDPAQQARQSKFLRPFQEAVQDAQGEVKKFNLEGRLDKLQTRLDAQTDDIAENIESLRENLLSAREALIQSQTELQHRRRRREPQGRRGEAEGGGHARHQRRHPGVQRWPHHAPPVEQAASEGAGGERRGLREGGGRARHRVHARIRGEAQGDHQAGRGHQGRPLRPGCGPPWHRRLPRRGRPRRPPEQRAGRAGATDRAEGSERLARADREGRRGHDRQAEPEAVRRGERSREGVRGDPEHTRTAALAEARACRAVRPNT